MCSIARLCRVWLGQGIVDGEMIDTDSNEVIVAETEGTVAPRIEIMLHKPHVFSARHWHVMMFSECPEVKEA